MGKVKRLTLDRYEHGLLVRALYVEWQRMIAEGKPTEDTLERVRDGKFWAYRLKKA